MHSTPIHHIHIASTHDMPLRGIAFSGTEALNQPFCYQLTFTSLNGEVNLDDLQDSSLTVTLNYAPQTPRVFNGLVTTCQTIEPSNTGLPQYTVTLEPWLSRWHYDTNCRVFEQQSALDIVHQLFQEYAIGDYHIAVVQTVPQWDWVI